jgi:hypothetical protein
MATKFATACIGFALVCEPGPVTARNRAPEEPCKGNRNQVADCFTTHGRMTTYNGSPTLRIWRIGTNRLLGISEAHPRVRRLPRNLEDKVDWGVEIFADFEVCPFAKVRDNAMQMVCVENASNLAIVNPQTANKPAMMRKPNGRTSN